jgi:Fe-Mn family superoxide dismutase
MALCWGCPRCPNRDSTELLRYSHRDGKLANQWASDHTHSVAGATPVLALGMYEHSYHMDYGAAAAKYVDAFMENIHWDYVSRLHQQNAR